MSLYLKNKELNEAELKNKKILLGSKPLTLRIILTNRCNINCIMCNLGAQKDKFTIPYEVINRIMDFFPYLERIDWQGGEVFLVEYFEELFQKASLFPNIRQTLQINGLLLDKRWAELLAKNNIVVLFSIDATTKKTYEYIRRGARFEDLLENIYVFNEYRKKYNSSADKILCVCIMRSNYRELEKFVGLAIKYDFKQISFGAIHGTNALNENIFDPRDSQAMDYLKLKMPIVEKMCAEKGIVLECSFRGYLIDKTANLVKNHIIENNNREIKCKLPWTNLCIDAIRGGDVYPECLCSRSAGNIMKDSLVNIWNSPTMQQYRLAIASENLRHICSEYCTKIKDN
jgi:MoaA/NifB/PqqE/SkfB family radical SAM enzyme